MKITALRGLYLMRNGHTAEVTGTHKIPYTSPIDNTPKTYQILIGRCVECNEPKTWNMNGHYAVQGKHPYDIISKKS